MYTASKIRKENAAEYLLYMWQIEDLIRANKLNIDEIEKNVISRYPDLTDERRKELTEWFESLIDMMHAEGVEKSGHLQINRNMMSALVDLHQELLKNPKYPKYTAEFYNILPIIVELRSKAGEQKAGEIETCFNALYGMLMLRLQKKDISPQTLEAMTKISHFIGVLAHYFKLDDENKLEDTE